MQNRGSRIASVAALALSLLLLIGIFTFLSPCGVKPDGTWMHCHQAGEAVKWLAGALALLSLGALLLPARAAGRVCAAVAFPAAIVTALVPGTIVPMCMPGMRCQTVTRPGVLVLCVLIAVGALAALLLSFRKERKVARR